MAGTTNIAQIIDDELGNQLYKEMALRFREGCALEPCKLYSSRALIEAICSAVLQHCRLPFDVILIASHWGRPLGVLLAYQLSKLHGRCYSIFDLEVNPSLGSVLRDKKVLAVDDALFTGGTLVETINMLSKCGADFVYYLVIVDHRRYVRENAAKEVAVKYPGQILALTAIE